MATEKQIAANRLNAKKSTGPGEAAKVRVRLNAKRDGITGQITTLSDEDRPAFEALKAELVADLAPKTVMELKLAGAIAWDTWRLDLLRASEMNLCALGVEDRATRVYSDDPRLRTALSTARTLCVKADRLVLLSLYEQRMTRNIHKNLATLRSLQADRKREEERVRNEETTLSRYCEIEGLTYQPSSPSVTNGIVFSTQEIRTAATRSLYLQAAKHKISTTPLVKQLAAAASAGPQLIWKTS